MTTSARTASESALAIVNTLRDGGHRALFAGGCVRDRFFQQTPNDYDIVTDAVPERVRALFRRSRLVGVKFGVVIVHRFGHDIEVATFRSDGGYSDGRHPDTVTFGTEQEDALRRDFTINGLYYDPHEDRIIDYVGGQEDLRNRILRTIGEPNRRFEEDHLRMLRAVRFAARFGLNIHAATWNAMRQQASRLAEISPERIWMELALILTDPSRASGWQLVMQSGLHKHLTSRWPDDPVAASIASARLAALPESAIAPELGLASLLACESPDVVRANCLELRISNSSRDVVTWLVRALPLVQDAAVMETADFKKLMSGPAWPELLWLLRAHLIAAKEPLDAYNHAELRASAITPSRAAPPPLVTGNDLVEAGMTPGPEMGSVLRRLYREQLNEVLTTRDAALARAREMLKTAGPPPVDSAE